VTAFNALMWDGGRTPTRVIDHGVVVPPDIRYTGELPRGIVIINHLAQRGRRLGADIYTEMNRQVPLDLVGMESEPLGGLGEVFPPDLPAFESRYRFYFHPIRFTSLGLALIEAMLVGLPVVGLATTELVTVIKNGVSGFVETDPAKLVEPMRRLLADPALARHIGEAGRRIAAERFDIRRFVHDWEETFDLVVGHARHTARREAEELVAAGGAA
jgi:glycosyltransferase involved in cell wall biosynthesis